MNSPEAELRGIKMNFYLINPDAEHRGILLIKFKEASNEIITCNRIVSKVSQLQFEKKIQ